MAKFRWKHLFSAKARSIRKADTARDSGAAQEAATLYKAVIDQWGPSFPMLMQLGNALKDSGSHAEAERVYLEALAIRPDDADAYLQRGHLMKLAGNLIHAEEYYRRANQLDPALAAAQDELNRLFVWNPGSVQAISNRHAMPEQLILRSDLPMAASLVFHRITAQYRWRRG